MRAFHTNFCGRSNHCPVALRLSNKALDILSRTIANVADRVTPQMSDADCRETMCTVATLMSGWTSKKSVHQAGEIMTLDRDRKSQLYMQRHTCVRTPVHSRLSDLACLRAWKVVHHQHILRGRMAVFYMSKDASPRLSLINLACHLA